MEGFDPQPKDTVRAISGPHYRTYIVVTRHGDKVNVRPLGFPDVDPVSIPVGALYPASFNHVYANSKVKGCGQ